MSAWKDLERRFAKKMNGIRLWRPDFGDSIPDGENDTHTWDSKCYQRHAAVSLFLENETKYKGYTGSRRFILVLFARERPKQGEFVVVRAADYIADQEALGRLTWQGESPRLRPGVDFACGGGSSSGCTEQCGRCRCEFG